MNKAEIAHHLSLKKKIPHYPQLPRFITQAGTKKYTVARFSKELRESCLRGFYKRLANWRANKQNQEFLFYHDPTYVKNAVLEEPTVEVEG